ncbi:helix-turn-helix transcriptional regulator [Mycolicibacterium baixiangningiae]|uniref:helix-turn-helix transcriptional regulator n=1 Tax=Mycolicibacterium baixiangningiae TaxID=2761578 RepID=UPI001866827C|nr:LuxR family transcriptional regulator [Mycolicibacterium baixiangningiae]
MTVIIVSGACVGRDRELGELTRRCAATADTGADVVGLLGPPGIGKSALLNRLAAEHGHAHIARALPWEAHTPGAVLGQLLQEDAPTDPAARFRDRIAAAAHLPAMVIVDDAEHSDDLSLQALESTVRHDRAQPLFVVLAMTSPDPAVMRLVSTEVRLTGLDTAGIAELAAMRGRVLHPTMVEALTRHTDGNPRDALALLDEVSPAVWSRHDAQLPAPAHAVSAVRERLEQCGPYGRALVEALAVLGDGVSLGEAAQLAGLDDPLSAIDEAVGAQLISATAGFEVALRSRLTRSAVLDLMGVHAAGVAHRRAADIVADPVRRLRHLVAATPTPDAALAADVDAMARERSAEGAWAEAATLFREASRLTPDPLLRDDRLTRSVDALVAAGDTAGAAALVPAVESLRETPLRDAALAYLAIVRGRAAEADVRLRRAWGIVNADRDPEVAALIAGRYVLHSLMRCRGAELVEWADRAIALSGDDSPAGVEAAAIRGLGLSAVGHSARAAAAYDELSSRIRYGAQAQRIAMGRGWLQLASDDLDGARSSLEGAVSTTELGGSARIALWALGWLARVQFLTGDWDQALLTVDRGRLTAASSGIVLATPLLEWTATQIHSLRGDFADAQTAVRAADAVTQGYEMMHLATHLGRAQVAEAEADYAAVRRALEPLTRMSGHITVESALWPWADVLANAMVLDGHPEAADAFLRPYEQRAARRGHRSTRARLGYARGRTLGAAGDITAARHAFDEALALLDGLPLRYDLARVNFAYGQTLRRAGKRRDADAVISTARDLFLSLGAQTYVARCERELKAGGVHVVRGPRGHAELTPQEDAVTSLVAQGLSNREVAAELYVSPKTVQYHLTRIYAKLGVRTRSELAALAASRP